MKRYTVKKIAELSGVSVRTLHFYDEVGLLKPAFIGKNGYRYYEREQLLILQQVLFYRKLGFTLEEIQKIVTSPTFNKIEALQAHRSQLEKDAERVRALIQTVDKTIRELKGDGTMKDHDLYYGFDSEKQKEYEKQLVQKFGRAAEEKIAESKRRMGHWTKEDFQRSGTELDSICKALVIELEINTLPSDSVVQSLIARHCEWLRQYWTPDRRSYTGLGQGYVTDFQPFYSPYHPKLAEYLAEGMRIYAEANLS